jgi:hypothetical protein
VTRAVCHFFNYVSIIIDPTAPGQTCGGKDPDDGIPLCPVAAVTRRDYYYFSYAKMRDVAPKTAMCPGGFVGQAGLCQGSHRPGTIVASRVDRRDDGLCVLLAAVREKAGRRAG